jgi:MinD superfamily P-loop ATPase
MEDQVVGQWYRSSTPYGPLFHAHLRPAQENSGKLVTRVKQNARLMALDDGYDLVLVDGPPGIGCPVIAAASGADMTLIVTEPTVAGVHDLQRIMETVAHFKLKSLVCVNKADLHLESYKQIERYCVQQGVGLVGSIPFDRSIPEAMVMGQPVNAFAPHSPASQSILRVWDRVQRELSEAGG